MNNSILYKEKSDICPPWLPKEWPGHACNRKDIPVTLGVPAVFTVLSVPPLSPQIPRPLPEICAHCSRKSLTCQPRSLPIKLQEPCMQPFLPGLDTGRTPTLGKWTLGKMFRFHSSLDIVKHTQVTLLSECSLPALECSLSALECSHLLFCAPFLLLSALRVSSLPWLHPRRIYIYFVIH